MEEEGHSHLSHEELEEIAEYIRKNLSGMKDEVKLVTFLDSPQRCHYCADLKVILDLINENAEKVKVEYYDFSKDINKVKEYAITYAPTIVLEKGNKRNIRYVGIPGGYEFTVFIETIRNLSNSETKLSRSTKEKLSSINKKIHIKILITLSCPYCPLAARTSNSFAIENDNILSEIVDVGEIEEEAIKYDVQAVPKIVINDSVELLGAQPENRILQAILSSLD